MPEQSFECIEFGTGHVRVVHALLKFPRDELEVAGPDVVIEASTPELSAAAVWEECRSALGHRFGDITSAEDLMYLSQ